MEMMIWSGPFATSWDLAFGSDSLLLGARWRWDSAFGRDSSIVCARWRWDSAFGRDSCFVCARWLFWLSGSESPIPPVGWAERRESYPSQDLYWGSNGSACAVPI